MADRPASDAARDKREVYVKNEQRAEGDYSIYVRSAYSQMSWYTGLTFSNRRDCDKMIGVIRSLWGDRG